MRRLGKVLKKIFWCFRDFNYYKLVALLGLIFRVIILPKIIPDFYEVFFGFLISPLGLPDLAYKIILHLCLAFADLLGLNFIFYKISFLSAGNSYKADSRPIWGSICYTLYYTTYMALSVFLLTRFNAATVMQSLIIYYVICGLIYAVSSVLDTYPKNLKSRLIVHIISTVVVFLGLMTLCFCLSQLR